LAARLKRFTGVSLQGAISRTWIKRLAQIRHQFIALGGLPHRLNVSGAGNDPQLLGFQRGIVQAPPVVHRHGHVPVSVDIRDRADARQSDCGANLR